MICQSWDCVFLFVCAVCVYTCDWAPSVFSQLLSAVSAPFFTVILYLASNLFLRLPF